MKLAVIGGGSTYTPELVDGIARSPALGVDELVLADPAGERLALIGGLATRMLEREQNPAVLTTTTDLDRAVDGADVVLIQLRVGGQAARLVDETFPLACGCVGQETWPTGSAGWPPRTPGSSTSPTRSASSPGRCWTRVTARSGCATSRSGSSAGSPSCWASARRGSSSTTSG